MGKKAVCNAASILFVLTISLGLVLFGWGCKKAPLEKMYQARNAFEAAQSAGAQNYAKAEYDAAKEQLALAERLVVIEKKYEAATEALVAAIEKSTIAEKIAIENKQKVKNEIAALIPEVEKTLKDAKAVQKWAANYADKVEPKVLDDLDKSVINAEAKLAEVNQSLSREDHLTAHWNATKIQESLNNNIKICQEACKAVGATNLSLKK